MRSRYRLMQYSEQRDNKDRFYPDPMTLPTHEFRFDEAPKEYVLSQVDIDRFDLLMAREYGTTDLDDIVLFVNRIGHIKKKEPGDTILLPTRGNLERFYSGNVT